MQKPPENDHPPQFGAERFIRPLKNTVFSSVAISKNAKNSLFSRFLHNALQGQFASLFSPVTYVSKKCRRALLAFALHHPKTTKPHIPQ
jgi:hypothetical protein